MKILLAFAFRVLVVLFVLCFLVAVAVAQDETPPTESIGSQIDSFLVLAAPAIALLVFVIERLLKWLLPDTVVSEDFIGRLVRSVAAVGFVAGVLLNVDGQLLSGVEFLNSLAEPLQTVLALLFTIIGGGLVFGASGVIQRAASDDSILGARQGPDFVSYAKSGDLRGFPE